MADIYISYSRLDRDRVQPIVDRLGSLGYSIWHYEQLRTDAMFVGEVEQQLDSARAVLTVWSHHARASTWVFAESSRAHAAQKQLQVRLDNVLLPAPFDAMDTADMSGERVEWGPLEAALERMVRGGQMTPAPARVTTGLLATPDAAGPVKLLTVAATATLLAYAGAVSAAYNDVMTPEQLQIALVGILGVGIACAALTAHRLFTIARAGG